jgi:polar amino acid transport system permease protein
MFEWLRFSLSILPEFPSAIVLTIQLTLIGLAIGFSVGLLAAIARVYGGKFFRNLAIAYIEFFRGTPILVQLFVLYFGLPDLGISLSRLTAACIALSLNSGAYQAEYIRGAIQAIGSGQMMAARSIGMSRLKAIWYIILPQALRLVIPPWSNEPIALMKTSAIVYLIAVPDLMTKAKEIIARTYNPIPTYITVALIYLVIVFFLTMILSYIERQVRIPGLEFEAQRT